MKLEYESPVLEVFSFEAKENVMNTPCTHLGCVGDIDYCAMDGTCYMDTSGM